MPKQEILQTVVGFLALYFMLTRQFCLWGGSLLITTIWMWRQAFLDGPSTAHRSQGFFKLLKEMMFKLALKESALKRCCLPSPTSIQYLSARHCWSWGHTVKMTFYGSWGFALRNVLVLLLANKWLPRSKVNNHTNELPLGCTGQECPEFTGPLSGSHQAEI